MSEKINREREEWKQEERGLLLVHFAFFHCIKRILGYIYGISACYETVYIWIKHNFLISRGL